jgi:hypothetical protein
MGNDIPTSGIGKPRASRLAGGAMQEPGTKATVANLGGAR